MWSKPEPEVVQLPFWTWVKLHETARNGVRMPKSLALWDNVDEHSISNLECWTRSGIGKPEVLIKVQKRPEMVKIVL